jgi:PAS domain S-box-containing protein
MTTKQEKARILIVEDELIIAADLENRLAALGYNVLGKTSSAENALTLIERDRPDLVLMDIVLKGAMNGIEAAETIRDKWGIPVIFLTAYAEADRLEQAKLAYPFGYLLKPFQSRDLKITLEMALYVAKVDAERRKVEHALQDEAIQRRVLVEGSRDGIVVLDENCKVCEANQRYAQMLGYTPEEMLELYVWDWDYQWSKEHLLEMIKTVDESGDHFETRHRRKDGTLLDVEISTNAAICNGRKLVFCVCRDITQRKQAEEALRKSEEKYRTLFEQVRNGKGPK